MHKIRDPIHGFINPSDKELNIINTALFQRLRKIKQLAMAYLVYPGANHTRFDHSLGVYHVASLMVNKLLYGYDDEQKRLVKFAALLHDVGHGPFSHISEYILDKYSPLSKETSKDKIHEKITVKLIENDRELKECLSPDERKAIIGLLSGKTVDYTVMKHIVSGPLDADKVDYLLRDSYFCGVKYGVFDYHQMLDELTSYKDDKDEYLAIKKNGVNTIEQFVLAKYYMTTQVYRHKVRSIADSMIIRGLELGIEEDKIEFLNKLFRYEDSEAYLENYLKYWDDKVISELIDQPKDGFAKDIFIRLQQRRLFKRVFSEPLTRLEIDPKIKDKIINIDTQENIELRKSLEEKISKIPVLKCLKEYTIVKIRSIKSMKALSQFSEEGEVMVIDGDREKRIFKDESEVYNAIDSSVKTQMYFEVYAPLDYADQKEKRTKLMDINKAICTILKKGAEL